MLNLRLLCTATILALSSLLAAADELRLPAIFSDHMVLQRQAVVPVWGWAKPGSTVQVRLGASTAQATTGADGRWKTKLEGLAASTTPLILQVSTPEKTLTVNDVLVGEVWLCSGQSNMALSGLDPVKDGKAPVPEGAGELRFFVVTKTPSLVPQDDCEARWEVCKPERVNFSRVAYHFGAELAAVTKLPVGLIGSYQGASPAQSWTSAASLQADPDLKKAWGDPTAEMSTHLAEVVAAHERWLKEDGGNAYRKAMADWNVARYQAQQKGQPAPPAPAKPTVPEPTDPTSINLPTTLFNSRIRPVAPYAIRGAIWYQGESNASKPGLYRRLFPLMISGWRELWGQGDFPFLAVQLPNYSKRQEQPGDYGGWPVVRETQLLALGTVPNYGLAVTIDVGEGKDLHPQRKIDVGHRLALQARKLAYGEQLIASGPLYANHRIAGGTVRVVFKEVGQGLKIGAPPAGQPTPPPPKDRLVGFSIAGADGKFVWAEAKIDGTDAVVVSSPQVAKPTRVRYGWDADPEVNLYNSADLPASPFRTDVPESLAP